MLQVLKLLLPALIPSWRFFDTVAASPRIEFRTLDLAGNTDQDWKEFRPRPAKLSVKTMLKRMLWNPDWNEFLFLTSCAERLLENPTEHSAQEILARIKTELTRSPHNTAACLQFRLTLVSRQDTALQKHIAYLSPIYPYAAGDAP